MNCEKKFEDLEQYVQMKNLEDIKNFEFTVWELAQTQDPEVLSRLIDYFDDNCVYSEVMYSLLHAIESYPDEIYIKSIIKKFEDNIDGYHDWFKKIIFGILNHPYCYSLFKNNIKYAPKGKVLKFLNSMDIDLPQHQVLIDDLKKILN